MIAQTLVSGICGLYRCSGGVFIAVVGASIAEFGRRGDCAALKNMHMVKSGDICATLRATIYVSG